jgi:hypothetical protein
MELFSHFLCLLDVAIPEVVYIFSMNIILKFHSFVLLGMSHI